MANKHKKRHSNSSSAMRQKQAADAIADRKDRDRRRMNPIARNILLGDLVFLATIGLLEQNEIITRTLSGAATILGALLIPVALYFQFIKKDAGAKGPRLK